MSELRVGGIVEESAVDGPGLRFVVFAQGCAHDCPGCHNPETHDPAGGYAIRTAELLDRFRRNPLLSGMTFSGGEPFDQAAPLAELAKNVHAIGRNVVVYSGHTLERLLVLAVENAAVSALLHEADILIDGPYLHALRDLTLPYRGSRNQRVLDRAAIAKARAAMAEKKP